MTLFCVGLSHHTTDVETRERFAGHTETECILRNAGCAEALLLTTCNRVEVYGASEKRVSTDEIARCLVREIEKDAHEYAPAFYRYEDEKCVQHLFHVASGLDSMVVGESEILGQAKKAYEAARSSRMAGPNCIVCSSALFEWRNRCALTPKSAAAWSRLDRSPSILRKGFSGNSAIAKSLCLEPARQVSAQRGRSPRVASKIFASAIVRSIGRMNSHSLLAAAPFRSMSGGHNAGRSTS